MILRPSFCQSRVTTLRSTLDATHRSLRCGVFPWRNAALWNISRRNAALQGRARHDSVPNNIARCKAVRPDTLERPGPLTACAKLRPDSDLTGCTKHSFAPAGCARSPARHAPSGLLESCDHSAAFH